MFVVDKYKQTPFNFVKVAIKNTFWCLLGCELRNKLKSPRGDAYGVCIESIIITDQLKLILKSWMEV